MRFSFPRTRRRASEPAPRVYAIGDVHGRLDLAKTMLDRIRDDVVARAPRSTRIVVLGDFIDRGPDSASLIDLFMRLSGEPNVVVLKGNHEAAMADALAGDHAALDLWLEHGGAATLASYGVDVAALDLHDSYRVLRAARQAIPRAVPRWLGSLPTFVRIGAYYFVHAGVRPGVPLDEQTDESRLWITDEFTGSDADHGAVVVHGHTICEDGVRFASNRIGVDTGAYRTNRLSAIGIEDDQIWVITAGVAIDEPRRPILTATAPA